MAKVQLESKYCILFHIGKEYILIFHLDLRQAERQGPLSKRFGMLVYHFNLDACYSLYIL